MLEIMDRTCPLCKFKIGSRPLECKPCLDYINWIRVLAQPPEFNDIEAVGQIQKNAIHNTARFIEVHSLNLDEMFLWMKQFEACAASISMLYQAKVIKERTPNIDKAEMSKAIEKSNAQQKLDNLPKKEKRILSERDKAVESLKKVFMAIMPEEKALQKAEEQVDARMAEVGRKVTVS